MVATSARPIMDDLTIEPAVDDRLTGPRPGLVAPAAPCRTPAPATGGVDGPLPPLRPGSIGIRYRLKRRFRTYDAIACVPAYLAQTRSAATVLGASGERMHGGEAYVPVLVGGVAVEASNENLDAIITGSIPEGVLVADHPAAAEHEFVRAMRPSLDRYLLVDGEIWIRASAAA